VEVEHETMGTLVANPGATRLRRAKRGRRTPHEVDSFAMLLTYNASSIQTSDFGEAPNEREKKKDPKADNEVQDAGY
jgi:hypothetical protein